MRRGAINEKKKGEPSFTAIGGDVGKDVVKKLRRKKDGI